MESFIDDILDSSLIRNPPEDLDDLLARCDFELSEILDKHASIKKRIVTIRPSAPWYSEEIKLEKRRRRELERRWRASRSFFIYLFYFLFIFIYLFYLFIFFCASRSLCHCEVYTRQSKVLKNLPSTSRRNYYSNLVAENQSNMRSLFTVFSKLLHRHSEVNYPQHDTSISFANDFQPFSLAKKSGIFVMILTKSQFCILPPITALQIVNCGCLHLSHPTKF